MDKASPESCANNGETAQRSLRYAVGDGIFYSIMSGAGEGYLMAFAVFLSATRPQIALLASLPQLLGALFQFLSVFILHLLNKRKIVILIGIFGQAATWPLILAIPFLIDTQEGFWLIGWVMVFSMFGGFASPPWNSLIGDLIDPNKRGDYFGKRNRWMSITNFCALCLGGIILHFAERQGNPRAGFAIIFAVAFISRLISASYIARMSEPPYLRRDEDNFSLWEFIRDGRRTNFGQFVIYTALMHMAVMVSGPFITPYLLQDLRFSYLQFMLATAAVALAQFLTLHLWGRFGDHFGNKRTLTLTGFALAIIPILWVFATNIYWAVFIQFVAGIVWAGFILSMGNFIFDTVSAPKRAQCVAIFSFANAIGIFLGSSLGGVLITYLPNKIYFLGYSIELISNVQILFILSATLRAAIARNFLHKFKETRTVKPLLPEEIYAWMGQATPERKTPEE